VILKDKSLFDIIPNSHKTTRGVEEEASVLADTLRIEFKKGDVIIFHPLILHNGAEQMEENTRIHFYFDTPYLPRRTFEGTTVRVCGIILPPPFSSIKKLNYLDGSPQTFMYDNRFSAETEAAKEQHSKKMRVQAEKRWENSSASKKKKLSNLRPTSRR